jgi:hypothetical protein
MMVNMMMIQYKTGGYPIENQHPNSSHSETCVLLRESGCPGGSGGPDDLQFWC